MTPRAARPGDEAGITRVHIAAWQETYRGLLPGEYLDGLPGRAEGRLAWWRSLCAEPGERVILVVEEDGEIVGFACLGPARDAEFAPLAELEAIYLLKEHHGRGVGFRLLRWGFEALRERGFSAAYCWVLEGNPTSRFYERTGAVFTGKRKNELVGGRPAPHLAYAWRSIRLPSRSRDGGVDQEPRSAQ